MAGHSQCPVSQITDNCRSDLIRTHERIDRAVDDLLHYRHQGNWRGVYVAARLAEAYARDLEQLHRLDAIHRFSEVVGGTTEPR